MDKKTEAMKLALEALEGSTDKTLSIRAMKALREALVEQPAPVQQEPETKDVVINNMGDPFTVKAYTTPQPAQQPNPIRMKAPASISREAIEADKLLKPQPAQQQQDDAWKAEQKTLADEAVKCAAEALANPNHPATMAAREYYGAAQQQKPVGTYSEIFESMRALLRSGRQADQQIYLAMQDKPLYASPPAQQEPVAWMTKDGEIYKHECWPEYEARPLVFGDTSPPAQRTWVGLTNEEIAEQDWHLSADRTYEQWTLQEQLVVCGVKDFARAIEAKLKEKNNG